MRAAEIERTWDALAMGRLSVQRCSRCGAQRFSTSAFCRACGSADWEWADIDGRGLVHSYTVVRRPRGLTTLVLVDVADLRILGVLRARRTPAIGAAVEVVPNVRREGPISFRLLD